MTMMGLLEALANPDHYKDDHTETELLAMEVEFCTYDRSNLTLLSCYESEGRIYVDIGDDDDD